MRDARALTVLDQVVVSGCNFATTVVVARTLSAHEFGLFSLAFMTCLFLSNLHRAGLTQPLNVLGSTEEAARLAWRVGGLLKAHIVFVPISTAVVVVASVALFPNVALALSAAAYVSCFALQESLRRFWYTRMTIGHALSNDVVSYVGQVVVLIAIALLGQLTASIALLSMGATSLLAFAVGVRTLNTADVTSSQSLRELAIDHWPLAKWLLLTVLAVWGAGQVYPLLMVPLGASAVATFAACRNLLNALGPIVQSVSNYIPTRGATVLAHGGAVALRRDVVRASAAAAVGGVLLLMLVNAYAEPLLRLLYGGRYDDAALILRIMSLGIVCSLLGAILGAYALAMKDARSSFLSNLGATVVTFTAGLWLIEHRGVEGAAIGAVLSLATAAGLQGVFVMQRLPRPQ